MVPNAGVGRVVDAPLEVGDVVAGGAEQRLLGEAVGVIAGDELRGEDAEEGPYGGRRGDDAVRQAEAQHQPPNVIVAAAPAPATPAAAKSAKCASPQVAIAPASVVRACTL